MADDEVLDTWEALEDSGELDRRLKNIRVKEINKSACQEMPLPGDGPMLHEDTQRSTFQPQVKILKRNTNNASDSSSDSSKNSGGIPGRKTLEEREAAYAEARLRIFGSAYSEENETSGAGDYSESEVARQLGALKVADASTTGILRQPHGPDGTKGFSTSGGENNRHVVDR